MEESHRSEPSGVGNAAPVPGGNQLGDASCDKPGQFIRTFRSLRHRNYRLYFFGQMVSVTGLWMQMTALRWLAYDLTDTSRWPGLLVAAQSLPMVLFAGLGGSVADRFSRRSVILWTQSAFMGLAFLLGVLLYAGLGTPALLLGFALATGLVHAVDLPTRLTLVKDLVARHDLMNAIALNSLLFNVARIVGPWLAGMVLVAVGPWPCFVANAVSYLAVLVALQLMVFPTAVPSIPPGAHAPVGGTVRAGLAYVAGQPGLALLMLLGGAVAIGGWPFLELLPALARQQLGVEEVGYSAMLSGTGVGALTAAFLVATFGSETLRRPTLFVGVCAVVVGLLGLSWSRSLTQGIVCGGVIGFGLIAFLTTAQTSVQLTVSDEQRGRVLGLWAVVWAGGPPLANLLLGPAADRWGVAVVLRAQGLGLTGTAVVLVLLGSIWNSRERVDSDPPSR